MLFLWRTNYGLKKKVPPYTLIKIYVIMKRPDFFSERPVFVRTSFKGDDIIPQEGLAITPSQIDNMARRGIAISAYNYGLQQQGLDSHSESVPIEFTRGFDKIDAWNVQQTARRKVNNARARDEKTFG